MCKQNETRNLINIRIYGLADHVLSPSKCQPYKRVTLSIGGGVEEKKAPRQVDSFPLHRPITSRKFVYGTFLFRVFDFNVSNCSNFDSVYPTLSLALHFTKLSFSTIKSFFVYIKSLHFCLARTSLCVFLLFRSHLTQQSHSHTPNSL